MELRFRSFFENNDLDSMCYFFGTFNPITNAHLQLARAAKNQFGLSQIIFVPSHLPPHKQETKDMASFAHRFQMCSLGTKEYGFQVSDIESKLKGLTYTVITLRALYHDFDESPKKIPFIIGTDALEQLHTWFQPEILAKKLVFLQAPRKTTPLQTSLKLQNKIVPLDVRNIQWQGTNISSTQVRQLIKAGSDISNIVPISVAQYIKNHNLYKNS